MSEIEWRRRWKPGFQAQTWAPLKVQGETYLFKSHFDDTNSSYEILLSDYQSVWYEAIGEEKLKKRSKRLNPNVEAPASKLLEHIKEQLEEKPHGTTLSVNIQGEDEDEDSRLQLSLTSKLAGLPYHWQFNATQAHKEMVADHLTLPVLTMVSEYQRRQEELFKALRAKDKEIEDLRAQGVKSSRRHLETGAFDETVFFNNMETSKEFEDRVRQMGSEAFGNGGQNLYKAVMAKRAWLIHTPAEDPSSNWSALENAERINFLTDFNLTVQSCGQQILAPDKEEEDLRECIELLQSLLVELQFIEKDLMSEEQTESLCINLDEILQEAKRQLRQFIGLPYIAYRHECALSTNNYDKHSEANRTACRTSSPRHDPDSSDTVALLASPSPNKLCEPPLADSEHRYADSSNDLGDVLRLEAERLEMECSSRNKQEKTQDQTQQKTSKVDIPDRGQHESDFQVGESDLQINESDLQIEYEVLIEESEVQVDESDLLTDESDLQVDVSEQEIEEAVLQMDDSSFQIEENILQMDESQIGEVEISSEEPSKGLNLPRVKNNRGPANYEVSVDMIEPLIRQGLTIPQIAKHLSISISTVNRRIRDYNLSSLRKPKFSIIKNDTLDKLISKLVSRNKKISIYKVRDKLQRMGYKIPRDNIQASLRRVDPAGVANRTIRQREHRTVYRVNGPNTLWYIESNYKLSRWGIVIHGAVDGFSRFLSFLGASEISQTFSSVQEHYNKAVNAYGSPLRIHINSSEEQNDRALFKRLLQGAGGDVAIQDSDNSLNARERRQWSDIWSGVYNLYYDTFSFLEHKMYLDYSSEVDMAILHFVYLPRLNQDLELFCQQWNSDGLSGEPGLSPGELLDLAMQVDSNVTDGLEYVVSDSDLTKPDQLQELLERNCSVTTPPPLTEIERELLEQEFDPLKESVNRGIDIYLQATTMVGKLRDGSMVAERYDCSELQ